MLMHMAQDLTTHIWLNSQINFLQSIFCVLQSKICSEKELRSGIVETDGEVPKKAAEEHDETELKGKEAGNLLLFEIPIHPSLAHPNQMANLDFPNLIAIDLYHLTPQHMLNKISMEKMLLDLKGVSHSPISFGGEKSKTLMELLLQVNM
ncbi:uncharacterized protein LOC142549355 [Primulina tabacum]|uniref:uncharacterized protein LOC142549355 n=1 Tax=Primulina tabacum TaxID=48773 RepID=UPI003F59B9FA